MPRFQIEAYLTPSPFFVYVVEAKNAGEAREKAEYMADEAYDELLGQQAPEWRLDITPLH